MRSWWRQVVTLNTTLLGLTGIFLKPTSARPRAISFLVGFWILQFVSLACASFKLWGWSTKSEIAAKRWEKAKKKTHEVAEYPVISLIAYMTFSLGIAFLLVFAGCNLIKP